MDRVVGVHPRNSVSGPDQDVIAYRYDPNGNMLSTTDNDSEVNFTRNSRDLLASVRTLAGGVQPVTLATYSDNAVNDKTSMIDDFSGVSTTTYSYDAVGRLPQVISPLGKTGVHCP